MKLLPLNLMVLVGLFPLFSVYGDQDSLERDTIKAPADYELADSYDLDKSSFYQKGRDYGQFEGRVSDRDQASSILKVQSENENIKFFKAGDKVHFKVQQNPNKDFCQGHIRAVGPEFFTMYVKNLYPCWNEGEYFRRGMILNFETSRLAERVQNASEYRLILLKRREDYFKQLNKVNHFIWSYKQQKVQLAAQYDKKIEELKKKKRRALEGLLSKKNDVASTQRELISQLDNLDEKLEFYRIENHSEEKNRWTKDHDLGLPVYRYPEQPKKP